MVTKPPVPYDLCIGVSAFSVLNVKALVGAFNQEKALVGAFSVIVQLYRLIVYSTTYYFTVTEHT